MPHALSARRPPMWLWPLLGAALVLAVLQLLRTAVGVYVDDARFLLRALSLEHGHYQALELPGHPPANIPSPGFPLLLLPFVALLGPHWSLLRWVMLAITAGSVYLFWQALRGLPTGWRAGLVALYALCPLTGRFGGSVLAESAVLLVALAFVNYFGHADEPPGLAKGLAAFALLSWLSLLRNETIVVAPVLLWPWIRTKGRGRAVLLGLAALLPLAAFLVRNHVVTHSATGYLSQWAVSWSAGRGALPALFAHWRQIADHVIGEGLLGLAGLSFASSHPRWGALLILLAIAALGASFLAVLRHPEGTDRRQKQLIGISLALLAVHSFWLSFSPHHFWPMVPGLLVLGAAGLRNLPLDSKRWAGIPGTLLTCLVVTYVGAQVREIGSPAPRLPLETFQWIRTSTNPSDILFGCDAATLTLYTQRPAISAQSTGGPDGLRYHLLSANVRWIVDHGFEALTFSDRLEPRAYRAGADLQARRWVEQWPAAFPPVYRNAAEGSAVYSVTPAPELVRAFPLYQQALDALRHQPTPVVRLWLDQALKIDPSFESALRMRGTLHLVQGRLPDAERDLDQAVRLRPWDALARLNRARLYKRLGRLDIARRERQEALDLLSLPGELPSLRAAAEAEPF